MASPFEAAARVADATVRATFGKPVRITPRVKVPSKAHGPDPDRALPARDPRGVFSRAPATERLQGARTGTQFNGMGRASVAPSSLWLPPAEVERLGWTPRVPDLVVLLKEPGQPRYAVAEVGPDERGGLTLTLSGENAA